MTGTKLPQGGEVNTIPTIVTPLMAIASPIIAIDFSIVGIG
ncbi:MAG: hypothetical protein AB4080_20050 [Trichodesmium sp.]